MKLRSKLCGLANTGTLDRAVPVLVSSNDDTTIVHARAKRCPTRQATRSAGEYKVRGDTAGFSKSPHGPDVACSKAWLGRTNPFRDGIVVANDRPAGARAPPTDD